MTRMSTIYSRLSYGSGTGLIGLGPSARAYAASTTESVWLLADKMAGLTLGDWAMIVGMVCTIGTCTGQVNQDTFFSAICWLC